MSGGVTSGQALRVQGLVKRFGGLLATDNVSLSVGQGEIHAIIGPNGAGKTTLFAQISGEITSDSGTVWLGDTVLTGLPPYRRAALGLGRTFQITSVFESLSVTENIALAVQVAHGHSFRFWRPARARRELWAPTERLLHELGLDQRAGARAADLSAGEKRALEIAMALATRPRLLLLDEPMAGMGPQDAGRIIALLAGLRAQVPILLVEHDMEAVFALADQVTVVVQGRVIASGNVAQIKASAAVQTAYLGSGED